MEKSVRRKDWLPAILVLLGVVVAFVCWARLPVASALPEGAWSGVEAKQMQFGAGTGTSSLDPEEVKAVLQQSRAWRMDFGTGTADPAIALGITIDGREWMMFVCENGCILTVPSDHATGGFWREERAWLTPGEQKERHIYYDGGALYRLLAEQFEIEGIDPPED